MSKPVLNGWGMVKASCPFAAEARRQNAAIRQKALTAITGRAIPGSRGKLPVRYAIGKDARGNEVSMTVPEIAAATGLCNSTIYNRICNGVTGKALMRLHRHSYTAAA